MYANSNIGVFLGVFGVFGEGSKMVKNGQKWSKMVKNGRFSVFLSWGPLEMLLPNFRCFLGYFRGVLGVFWGFLGFSHIGHICFLGFLRYFGCKRHN